MSHARKTARSKRSGNNRRGALVGPLVYKQMRFQGITQKNKVGGVALICGLGLALIVVLGFALMVFIGHSGNIASASGGGPSLGHGGYGSLNHAKGLCGNAGQAACPAVDPGWFPVASTSPTVVATAIARSKNFMSMQAHFGFVGLDIPALVYAYDAHTGNSYFDDDHWVVSVRNARGMRCGVFDFVYDRVHQRMRFSSYGVITPVNPHATMAFPYTPSSVAVTKLEDQRRLNMKIGTQPELIFFPIDPDFPYLISPVHKWVSGGNSAMDPMWRIVGSNGQDYFVGPDLQVHRQNDLPVAKEQV